MKENSEDSVESNDIGFKPKQTFKKASKLTTEIGVNQVPSYGSIYADTIFLNDFYSKHASLRNESFTTVANDSNNNDWNSFKYLVKNSLSNGDNKMQKRPKMPYLTSFCDNDRPVHKYIWNKHLPGTEVLENNEYGLQHNKFACSFDINDTFAILYETLRYNIFVFVIELFRGPTEETSKLLQELNMAKNFVSRTINNPIQNSGLSKISSRRSITGLLKKRLDSVQLKKGDTIIVTANRKFAQLGSKNVIYVNCLANITNLKPCDYILIDDIRLKVIEQVNISAMCEIICDGILKHNMQVILPKHCLLKPDAVTPEEIEDIKYSKLENINCIILPNCDYDNYLDSIHGLLESINFNYCRLFATVYAFEIDSMDKAKLISEKYDGLNLNIHDPHSENSKIIQLSEPVKYLIEQFYSKKKAILMNNIFGNDLIYQSILIHPDSLKHILYYPDKFILKVTELKYYITRSYINKFEESKYDMIEFALAGLMLPLEKTLISESEVFARSIVKTAYNCDAKCIIVSSKSGRMAVNIAHYRPNIPIIVLIDNLTIVRFLCIYYNIWIVYYKSDITNQYSLRLKKLVCGLLYATTHNISVEEDNIVYVYKIRNSHVFHKMCVLKISNNLLHRISDK